MLIASYFATHAMYESSIGDPQHIASNQFSDSDILLPEHIMPAHAPVFADIKNDVAKNQQGAADILYHPTGIKLSPKTPCSMTISAELSKTPTSKEKNATKYLRFRSSALIVFFAELIKVGNLSSCSALQTSVSAL
eukprot:Phypoly_transcript_12613.p1 GENE.Phypoly_transcript_12613~~Phypoly_transcript_12613.p1  ORF type:complete len:136 (-),score=12.25 Phypoly_transcript_12613:606-1013(-)